MCRALAALEFITGKSILLYAHKMCAETEIPHPPLNGRTTFKVLPLDPEAGWYFDSLVLAFVYYS